MWHLATAHAQNLHSGWAYNRVKILSRKNFKAKEGMGVYSRWAYFREGMVFISVPSYSTNTDMPTLRINCLLAKKNYTVEPRSINDYLQRVTMHASAIKYGAHA